MPQAVAMARRSRIGLMPGIYRCSCTAFHPLRKRKRPARKARAVSANAPGLLVRRACRANSGLHDVARTTGVEIVPVHDGVEPEHVRALRLPAPVRPNGEHDHVPTADGRIDHLRTIDERLAAGERAREEDVGLI